MDSFFGKFKEALAIVPAPYTCPRIQDAIETLLGIMDLVDTDPDGLHMLCGIVSPGSGMRLLKTSRKIVSEVQGYDYVGVGDSSLLRFLGSMLNNSSSFTARQAFMLATYFVMRAKAYIDGCGGDTDALILRPDGQTWPKSGQTYNAEQQMLFVEQYLRKIVPTLYDKRVSDEEFGAMVDGLAKDLKDEHFQIGISIE
jgi:hypothetical protein